MKFLSLALCALALIFLSRPADAQDFPLSISSDQTTIELTLSDLDQMSQVTFTTTTTWTEGEVTFSGVPLSRLLQHTGVTGVTLRMVALNDYAVDIPIDEIGDRYPIVATRMNGEKMRVRDKGPYWIVYPYDSDPTFQTETTYARSIWQLKSLSVIE